MMVRGSTIARLTCCAALLGPLTACGTNAEEAEQVVTAKSYSVDTGQFPSTFARQWMTNLANSVKGDGISPPVAARTYTYGSVALYESVVHGMPGYRSLAGQLNGLESLPTPDPALEYDWPSVMAQTMHRFVHEGMYVYPLRIFFEFTTQTQASLTSLGPTQLGFRRAAGVSEEVMQNSIAFGDQLGLALLEWARADGYAQARFQGYVPPTGPDKWVPTGFSDTDKIALPAEPHFGTLRPMVLTSGSECPAPPPAEWSTDPASEMYQEALAVWQTNQDLTDEQRVIARFWADGPKDTSTPPGHWLAIATKFLRTRNLGEAAAGYAFTSLAYYDAFIAVWYSKYEYNLLRPTTYIRRHIDPGFLTFLPTPQFPEYVSGHSGVSGASAVVFTEWFGDAPFVDDTKLRRGFAARSFANFEAAADEAVVSRLYGGIHYPMGNEEGKNVGVCVGNKILSRISMTE